MAVLEQGGNAFDAAVAAGLHAAGRRAAPERPRRRPAGAPLAGRARRAGRALRAGAGAARGDDRALPRRARARARARAPGPLAAVVPGRVRRLARDAARLRHAARCATSLRFAIGYAEHGYPMLAADRRGDPQRRAALPRRVDDVGRGLPACAGAGHAARATRRSRRRTGGSSRRRRRGRPIATSRSRRRTTRGTAASSPRRSSGFSERAWLDSSGERHSRPARRGRPARLAAALRAAARGRLPRR